MDSTLSHLAWTYSPPAWFVEMLNHYAQNKYYRAADIHRVLGEQTERVEMGQDEQELRATFLRRLGE